jgi:UDP-N-acetylmuramoyl-L-alanyl-D-glutamate--2,6-diaminopimelate ligase
MKKVLADILYKVSLESIHGSTQIEVDGLAFDSREVSASGVFVAIRGTNQDGHTYISKVVASGVRAIVCEYLPETLNPDIVWILVKDSAEALGLIASNWYGNPSAKLKLVGVTGTNGKTTTATLLYQLFGGLGYKTGLLSTVENRIGDEVVLSTHTTPDPISLNALLAKMVASGCTHAFMEVSSHAAVQRRIAGLAFAGAMFTNITHDHLDYHGTFDAYIAAKKLFFDHLQADAFALLNADDKRAKVMVQNSKALVQSFSLLGIANYKGKILASTIEGLEMEVNGKSVWFRLIGEFNAYNLLGVYGAAILLGEDSDAVLQVLSSLPGASGRFEQVSSPKRLNTAIVDYAHTPDALSNVLQTIIGLKEGNQRVISVVGCGGDRDAAKRPLMADIATRFSDVVILTSDNPRSEEPQSIINQMAEGVRISDRKKVMQQLDRREAIRTACMMAQPGDIILIAGKGHETYQEIKGIKHPFDDRIVVKDVFKELDR